MAWFLSASGPSVNRHIGPFWLCQAALVLCSALAVGGCKKAVPEAGGPAAGPRGAGFAEAATRDDQPGKQGGGGKSAPADKDKTGAPPAEDTDPPPGVDLTGLDDFERKVFFRIVNREGSVCGKAHSLIHSVKNDRDCRKSQYAIRYVARLVDTGLTDSEIEKSLNERYRSPQIAKIDVSQAPSKGNPNAPVTIVEYVDYECPHCRRVQPVLRQLMEEFGTDVRVVHKHYPLGQHTNARMAAIAAVAAHRQGKFWPYNEKLWEHSDMLTKALLEKLAADVGLDLAQFRSDLDAPGTETAVQNDKSEGQRLGIQSTPSIFINGKLFTDSRDVDNLRDWVLEALGR